MGSAPSRRAGRRRPVRERNTSSRSADRTDRPVDLDRPPRRAGRAARAASARRRRSGAGARGPGRRAMPPPSACAARSSAASSANSSRTLPPGTSRLSSAGVPCGDDAAAVEQRDPAREPVGLLEVLRRQEDRDAVGDEVADDVPHHPPAARVEAGRRLVEEDDPRVADERHREVEPSAHAARVGHRGLRGRVDEVEPLEQLGHPPPARAPGPGGGGRPSGAGSPRP